jgi:TonB family protein
MSAKTRITIAILLLFIPVVLGIGHRIYNHGKDSFVFFWKKPRCGSKKQNYQYTPQEAIKEVPIKETEQDQAINKEIKNAPAHFIGGNEAMQRYIKNEVKYPENQKAQGSVFLKMCIDEQGYTTNITVTKSMGSIFDTEAIRVVETMPIWEPQIKNHKVVKSDFIFVEIPFIKPTNK